MSIDIHELNKILQWQDFHDSALLSLSFHFQDRIDFTYNPSIIMEIVTSFKNDPEKPIVVICLFKDVKDIEIDAKIDDNLSDLCTIYSLSENNGKIELISVNGGKLSFFTSKTEISILS